MVTIKINVSYNVSNNKFCNQICTNRKITHQAKYRIITKADRNSIFQDTDSRKVKGHLPQQACPFCLIYSFFFLLITSVLFITRNISHISFLGYMNPRSRKGHLNRPIYALVLPTSSVISCESWNRREIS